MTVNRGVRKGFWLIAVTIFSISARAEDLNSQPYLPPSPLEVDENDHPIIPVKLINEKGESKVFRFGVDTGSGFCIVDRSLSDTFFQKLPDIQGGQAIDDNGVKTDAKFVILRKVDAGGLIRDGVPALVSDLKGGNFARIQDNPIDGVLGMTFLRNTRFSLDIAQSKLTWFAKSLYPEVLRLQYGAGGVPIVTMSLGANPFCAVVDTGALGPLCVPETLVPKGLPRQARRAGGLFSVAPGESAILEVSAMNRSFGSRVVYLSKKEVGTLSLDAFKSSPVFFDFCFDYIGLPPEGGSRWAMKPQDPVRPKIFWDRSGATPSLEISDILPGSKPAKIGMCNGDKIVKVGKIEGMALNRRLIIKAIANNDPVTYVVNRNGKLITFK